MGWGRGWVIVARRSCHIHRYSRHLLSDFFHIARSTDRHPNRAPIGGVGFFISLKVRSILLYRLVSFFSQNAKCLYIAIFSASIGISPILWRISSYHNEFPISPYRKIFLQTSPYRRKRWLDIRPPN